MYESKIRRLEDSVLENIVFIEALDSFTESLTQREFEVICARVQGFKQYEIADALGLTDNRVHQLMKQLRKKAVVIFNPNFIEGKDMKVVSNNEITTIYRFNR